MAQERAPRMTIDVPQEQIDDSVKRDSSHCMIAESLKAACPGISHVSVDLQTIRFTDPAKGRRYTYLTPRVAQVALIDFDQGDKPAPFSFRLRNGQVTASGRNRPRSEKPQSEAQRAQRAEALRHRTGNLGKARLVSQTQNLDTGNVPDKIGGKTPPVSRFAKRREFGLRGLSR